MKNLLLFLSLLAISTEFFATFNRFNPRPSRNSLGLNKRTTPSHPTTPPTPKNK